MKKSRTFTLRLDPEQDAAVQELAKKFKVGEADVIRWALDALREYVALHDGFLHLPIDFTTFWQKMEDTAATNRIMLNDAPAPYNKKK